MGAVTTRSNLVIESIKSAILSGQLKPDQVLVERRIAERLGVSKTPVREALIALARSGLLTTSPNQGISVRRLSLADIRHVYEERVLLEPWALAQVIGSGERDFATAADALDDARSHAASGDVAARALANRRFHRGMYSLCENDFVVRSLDGLQDLTALASASVLWEKWPTWDVESIEHRAIFDAACRGEADAAQELMHTHIETSIARVRAQDPATD